MQGSLLKIKAECELNTTTSEVKIEKFDYQLYDDEMNEGTIPNFKKEKNIIKQGNSQNRRIECSDCDQTFCYESGLNIIIIFIDSKTDDLTGEFSTQFYEYSK